MLLGAASGAAAHHSATGQFDMSKTVTLRGSISKVDWINPHPYVYLDVKDTNGKVETWALESVPLAMLRKMGLTKEALKGRADEVVTITAMPAWTRTVRLGWIKKITYSDGHYYQLSSQ